MQDESGADKIEPYLMYDTEQARVGDFKAVNRKLIIKSTELTFNDVACLVINIKDDTVYDKLEKLKQSEANLKLLTT